MRASWDLEAVHTSIAKAAVDPSCWTPTLDKIALVTGAVGAALIVSTNDRPLGEAKLAARVASGQQLELAADELGIAYQTARNQMQAIFAKTDTHRQAEFVALFARLQGAGPHNVLGLQV